MCNADFQPPFLSITKIEKVCSSDFQPTHFSILIDRLPLIYIKFLEFSTDRKLTSLRDHVRNFGKKIDVALYRGPGAELVHDVEKILKNHINYRFITASKIRKGALKNYEILIMAGGYTARYIPTLKAEGCNAIKKFLWNEEGKYLGICAGAYIAGSEELKICKSRMLRKAGIFTCKITIADKNHPIFADLDSPELEVYYQNGPHIHPHKDEKPLALYSDGTASLIETTHALIFSWHPEKLPSTSPILLRSIDYLLK